MGTKIPSMLTRGMSANHARQVAGWWKSITPEQRRTLRRNAGGAPAGVMARFVRGDEAEETEETSETFANIDFYEYLVNHEVFLEDGRSFHICSAHPAARAALAAGHIDAAFRCPRADAACPMRALLDRAPAGDRRSVQLSLLTPSHAFCAKERAACATRRRARSGSTRS
jgi:hypothetical protein